MWPNPQFPADLVTFTEEILNGKLHFLCSVEYTNNDDNKKYHITKLSQGIFGDHREIFVSKLKTGELSRGTL